MTALHRIWILHNGKEKIAQEVRISSAPIPKIKKAVAHLTKLVASASQILVSSQSINMPYTNGTYHRRADNQICGSEKNHSKTHTPADEAGVVWQKTGTSCMPKYLKKDQDIKIRRTVEKMNDDYNKKKKFSCFPKK